MSCGDIDVSPPRLPSRLIVAAAAEPTPPALKDPGAPTPHAHCPPRQPPTTPKPAHVQDLRQPVLAAAGS